MCGIWGFVGKKENNFDLNSYIILGVANDTRGGDSTGIFIDGQYEYGVDKKKLFANFYEESTILNKLDKVQIAIGHDRKASVGVIEEKTAQPVVIKNDDGEVDFVLIHNGTIVNYKELDKKYLEQTPAYFTDSQTMAYIMYYNGYDVLKEYIGAGAFVTVDYRKDRNNPTTRIFKGESKYNTWAKEPTEERSLYFSLENDGIWFSSINSVLKATRFKKGINKNIDSNHLYTIKNGKIINKKKYDRSDKWQIGNKAADNTIPFTTGFGKGSILPTIGFTDPVYKSTSKLMMCSGYYVIGEEPATGIIEINKYGFIKGTSTYAQGPWYEIPVFEGVLLNSLDAFYILDSVCCNKDISEEELLLIFPEIVMNYAVYPLYVKEEQCFYVNSEDKPFMLSNFAFNGKLPVLFDYPEICYNIANDDIVSITKTGSYNDDTYNKAYLKVLEETSYDINKEVKFIEDVVLKDVLINVNK